MTGLDTAALLDRIVPAEEVFDADWQALLPQVAQADNDDQRVALVEAFLLPRWQQSRPASALHSHRLTDWSRSAGPARRQLGPGPQPAPGRTASSNGPGKRSATCTAWAARSAFFEGAQAHQDGAVHWGEHRPGQRLRRPGPHVPRVPAHHRLRTGRVVPPDAERGELLGVPAVGFWG